ncbi:MAG TPA: FMN-binding protein [Alphaproteobacteria bacterium]|nr:FMN-binding protein [Alphaproteobacteria bacterium]
MSGWKAWLVPPAIVIAATVPARATQYLSVADAQRLAFPAATQFQPANVVYTPQQAAAIEKESGQPVRTRGEQVWRAVEGDKFLGFFIVDYVIGKHLVIDYAVALEPDGKVRRVEILEYRESYGFEVANADWLRQFEGKTSRDPVQVEKDIRNISGATLSSHHVTEGVKRVLAFYDVCLR